MSSDKPIRLVVETVSKVESDWVATLSALLVPVLTVVGIYVAYQQYVINRQRLNYETYERRLAVYKAVQLHLSKIAQMGTTTYQDTLKFNAEASEADFLFGSEISELIASIYKQSISMASYHERLYPSDGSQGLPVGDERSDVAEKESVLLQWHMDTLASLKSTFHPHMKIT
ncbi:TPA: hypothetical protein JG855_004574 [Vibrio parahaemolyticus]|uniref:hypothetical protein n=1 Tax=Vibrio parahaemolyticus TaxID=670 RepID=UPI001122FA9C|nr:hypothetical protein [Vibrio parahaemolyticus]EGQ9921613.1 hypothetical protein [Vibrio parahaemolyticus]MDF4358940.1 hypothetical protein [Vibrio parahaemolyticus]MDF4545600.1 hypothetical protein [Vibrio parahaemolyticus]MDF4560048.1 hypothetical protein [Vibrio parahaemolyticus]MDF4564935.1 hypothetical protein [Vibrio parahaemolyticus]